MKAGLLAVALLASSANAEPVLVEDVRFISAFAHAIDAGGAGLLDGPNVETLSALGAHFAGLVAGNSAGANADAITFAGTKQFSFFQPGSFGNFTANAIAEVGAISRPGATLADARGEAFIHLVFQLDTDTRYELTGELQSFIIGGGESNARVTFRAVGAEVALFERAAAGEFFSSGTLEKGSWVLELLAESSLSMAPGDLEEVAAGAIFRDVSFILVPTPGSGFVVTFAGALLARRQRGGLA